MKSLGSGLLLFMIIAGCDSLKPEFKKPNIILLLADDMGYNDLSIHGNPIFETPNIDQLASESVQFSRFYVNPVCAPSRASLLTGRDFLRTGVSHVHGGKDFINLNEKLLPEALKDNGYRTGMWGKWHSGTTMGYLPQDRGFDEVFMADLYRHENPTGVFNGAPVQHQGWVDSILVDYAIDFIEKGKDLDQPFFAYIPFLAPHMPAKAPRSSIEKYKSKGLSDHYATLAGMIDQLDQQVGRLNQYLKANDLEENTIVIFLSDNGPQYLGGFLTDEEERQRDFNGLKGHKGNIWELGVKSPLFIKFKEFAPRLETSVTSIIDLFPTLVELAGGALPADQLPIDGQSLVSILDNKSFDESRLIFNFASLGWAPSKHIPYTLDGLDKEYDPLDKTEIRFENQIISVYQENYKLLINPAKIDLDEVSPASSVLINLVDDPGEKNNLASVMPELTNQLREKAVSWFDEVLKSEHSFMMPTFQVSENSDQNSVLAKAPSKIGGGLKNTALSLKYWRTSADFATYQIAVDSSSYFAIDLSYDGACDSNPPNQIIISVEDQELQCELNETKSSGCGQIFLEKGNYTLKVRLQNDTSLSCEYALISLKEIILTPVNN